ncbi:MAG: GNAT family N-acetyltransferase [Ruminococcaceae bacterium]|nr:GNAT family N-acetyltransferase [Oscillospiraceae bacterium]
MLTFEKVTPQNAHVIRRYYENCDYRLCEYAAGTKVMWRGYLNPAFAEAAGCLVVCNCIGGKVEFDLPVPGPEGDMDAALTAIEDYCTQKGLRPVISVVPAEQTALLCGRYARVTLTNERVWKDYLYRAADMASFAGRRYSGQRNHINKFRKGYPQARFVELTTADAPRLDAFWEAYGAEFQKGDDPRAVRELANAREMFTLLDTGWFRTGALEVDGKLIAVCLAEKCGSTLVIHVEKALYSYEGVYPALVQAFAVRFGGDCQWINREDDARDKGLRTSKMQYLPAELGSKVHFAIGCELDDWDAIPSLTTERLTLDALREADKTAYNALCLDDERNRWWGYDYRADLKGELTEEYFLDVARRDFDRHLAVNFAVRLEGCLIGEAVLYNFDWKGGAELGCRIAPAFAGHGYGTEAFAAAAEWALYRLGLGKVVAKCCKENAASFKMLSSCMRRSGEDETFYYFIKTV